MILYEPRICGAFFIPLGQLNTHQTTRSHLMSTNRNSYLCTRHEKERKKCTRS